ncbi:MAG: hypothetical protein NW237_02235 [Cyanobacteriota bacterium]|nr:hypothetical protein [Cyanobacteriota bacterium]
MTKARTSTDVERFEIRLGETLNRAGLLSGSQLAQAMWEKSDSPLMLGEICLGRGWIKPQELYRFVPSTQLRMGEILVLYGHLQLDQLQEALQQQQRTGARLGDILVDRRWASSELVAWAAEEQRILRQTAAPEAWQMLAQRLGQEALSEKEISPALVEELQAQIQSLQEELLQEKQQSAQFYQQARNLAKRQMDRQDYVHQMEAQLQEFQTKAQRREQFSSLVDEELQHHRTLVETLQQQLDTANQQKDELQQELITLKTQQKQHLDELQKQLKQQLQSQQNHQSNFDRTQHHQHSQEIQRLQVQLAHHQHLLEQAHQQAGEWQQQLQEQSNQAKLAQSTKTRLIADLADLRRQLADLQLQLQSKDRQLEEQMQLVAALKTEMLREKKQTADIQTQWQQAQAETRSLQQELERLKMQRSVRTMMPTKIEAEALSASPLASPFPPLGVGSTAPPEAESALLAASTPWAQRVLRGLRSAALIDNRRIDVVLRTWEKEGGNLAEVLSRCARLKPETIKFFSEGGYSVRLSGSHRLEDYLKSAALVSPEELQATQPLLQPGKSLAQALIERGLISQATIDYFLKTFRL